MGPNGHYFRFVNGTVGLVRRRSRRSDVRRRRDRGYLATITSQAEQDFVYTLIGTTNSVWLGGQDSAVEGVWRWAIGPEAGTQFSTGSAPSGGTYRAVRPRQPDDAGDEDCLHIYRSLRERLERRALQLAPTTRATSSRSAAEPPRFGAAWSRP